MRVHGNVVGPKEHRVEAHLHGERGEAEEEVFLHHLGEPRLLHRLELPFGCRWEKARHRVWMGVKAAMSRVMTGAPAQEIRD